MFPTLLKIDSYYLLKMHELFGLHPEGPATSQFQKVFQLFYLVVEQIMCWHLDSKLQSLLTCRLPNMNIHISLSCDSFNFNIKILIICSKAVANSKV
jgi:hypothetical protein